MDADKIEKYRDDFLNKIKPKPYLKFKDYDLDKRFETLSLIAKTMDPDFALNEDELVVYKNAIKYFAADINSVWSLNKGLYVYGKIGVGKTTLFRILDNLNKAVSSENGYSKYTSTNLVDGFQKKGFEYFEQLGYTMDYGASYCGMSPTHLLLDDLGQSANIAKHFGSSTNIISEFIQRRYNVFTDYYKLTHISTNIEPSEIKDEYGEFVASRMSEMFNIILYPGKDKRK